MKLLLALLTAFLILLSVFFSALVVDTVFKNENQTVLSVLSANLGFILFSYGCIVVNFILIKTIRNKKVAYDPSKLQLSTNEISVFSFENNYFIDKAHVRTDDNYVYINQDKILVKDITTIKWRSLGIVEALEIKTKNSKLYLTAIDSDFIRENHKMAILGGHANTAVGLISIRKNENVFNNLLEYFSAMGFAVTNGTESFVKKLLSLANYVSLCVLPVGLLGYSMGDLRNNRLVVAVVIVAPLICLFLFINNHYKKYAARLYKIVGASTLKIV